MVYTPNQNFTPAQDEYSHWMSQWERAKKKNKIKNAIVGFRMVADSRYRNSPLARKHQGIDYTAAVGSAGSKHQKLLNAARKEQWNQSQREAFRSQDFTSMEEFYSWAKDQPPWYDADMASKDATTVKSRLDAMKSTKVAEAVDTLFGEYNDEWITGSYAEQNQVRQNIADSDAIKNLPSKWRASAVDEVIKMLNTLLSPTGQYAAEDQRLQVRAADEATAKHKATLQKTAMDKSRDMVANDIVADAAACVLAGGDRETCLQEAKDKQSVTYGNIVEQISEDVRKKFDAESPKPTKRQTETYYDPDLQDYVLATEEEAEAEGLLPEKVGARLQPQLMSRHNAEDRFWLDAGDELKREGVLSRDIFEFYRRHARRVDDPREQDSEIIRIWKARKKKLEAEAKAVSPSIIFQTATGAFGGQTDDGIENVRIKPTNQ
jgi:hypothetical protein